MIRLMEEILLKKSDLNWCRISSINSTIGKNIKKPSRNPPRPFLSDDSVLCLRNALTILMKTLGIFLNCERFH